MIKQALIIPDCHFPVADIRAYDLMLSVAQDLPALEEIVFLGDFADFYGVSRFAKDPSVKFDLLEEVNVVNDRLDEIDTLFPDTTKVFITGNHEDRLARFIAQKAPELFGHITVESLFKFSERKYKYIPYGPAQLYRVLGSKLIARHESIGGATHAAHSTVTKAGCSIIFGHHHKIQEAQIVTMDGENHRGICTGWLGDKNSAIMNYVHGHHQWALGFSVVNVLEDGTFFNHIIHIVDYKCSFNGNIYYG